MIAQFIAVLLFFFSFSEKQTLLNSSSVKNPEPGKNIHPEKVTTFFLQVTKYFTDESFYRRIFYR